MSYARYNGLSGGGGGGGGSVNSVTASSPLASSGGSNPNISLTGLVGINHGGTGQATANAALNALLPTQATHNGQFLKTDGTNTSWASTADTGITSINSLTALSQFLVTGTAGTDFGISSVTDTHTFNLPFASGTNTGKLSNTDWSTFNSKQPAGNYITALTGDIAATGPGSVVSTLKDIPNKVYVDFISGNDANTGTLVQPWKTLQHAYNSISPTINEPYVIYLSGGNNDTDGAITAKPNVSLVSDYLIQVGSSGFTISGGTTNDGCSFVNIIFLGAFSWVRNDNSAIGVTFNNCQFFSGPTVKQTGSGTCSVLGISSVFVNSEFQLPGAFGIFNGCSFLGTTTFDDPGSSGFAYLEFDGGYSSGTMSFTGLYNPIYFTGFVHDLAFGAAVSFSAGIAGPSPLEIDSNGLPPTVTGTPGTITYLSQAKYLNGTLPIANGGTGQTTASAAFGALSPLTTKGDLVGFSTLNARVPVGTDGQVLTADSGNALGVSWQTPSSGGTSARVNALYDEVVGSSGQVSSGAASQTSINAAIAAVSTDGTILILRGSYTESVVVNKRVFIQGQGFGSIIDGTLEFATSSDDSLVQAVKVNDDITIDSGVTEIQLVQFWQANGKTITDNGSGNFIQGMRL